MPATAPIRFGEAEYDPDIGEIQPLRPSHDIRDDPEALHARFEEDGYLYLPGFLDRDEVLDARATILHFMDEHEGLEPGSRPLDGVMGEYGKSVGMMGKRDITHDPSVRRVLESPRLFDFYTRLFGEKAMTYDYKWLRAVGNEQCSGAHLDEVYMGRGSQRVMTAWIPFGDIPVEQGTLAICEGSHRLEGFAKLRATYGKSDVDIDGYQGWFTKDPRSITDTFGGRWRTNDVAAGDLLTFGLWTMHASTTNTTDKWRLSCDVRYQPAAEPADDRWIGEKARGHSEAFLMQETPYSMEEMREKWGV
ncbi:MAG: phytanoyl-CoA dioxygenase family protein [Phycisphaeraceae bacterium]